MYFRLPIFSLLAAAAAMAAAALVGPPAGAQVLAARPAAVAAVPGAVADGPRAPAASGALDLQRSMALRSSTAAAGTTVQAAGSVLLLADGIVVDARIAPLAPPPPGFVYER